MLLCIAMWGAALDARAQAAYKCSSGGTIYYADRPCEGTGPQAGQTARSGAVASVGRPAIEPKQDISGYLSAHCASLRELAFPRRPSSVRSSWAATIEASTRYREECEEEDTLARQRLNQDLRNRQQARQQSLQEEEQQREQQALHSEQCEEMGRIRKAKQRQQASMTPGEKNDFARFMENFNARCLAR